jgi:hypothetical protein
MTTAVQIENKTEAFRARLTELHQMQTRIPHDLASAEERLIAARERAREARGNVIRIRALAEIGEASAAELKAIEHASRLAAESEREADDRLATISEKLPALAAAIANSTESYRAERAPELIEAGERVAGRIERAFAELEAAFKDGDALAAEITTDFTTVRNAHGFVAIDNRVAALPAVLGFGTYGKLFKLAERWRALRGKV